MERRTHSSFASFHTLYFLTLSFLFSLTGCLCSVSFVPPPPNSLAKEYGYLERYRRNAVVRRIEMFDHTRDWFILYIFAAFYFSWPMRVGVYEWYFDHQKNGSMHWKNFAKVNLRSFESFWVDNPGDDCCHLTYMERIGFWIEYITNIKLTDVMLLFYVKLTIVKLLLYS